MLLLKIFFQAKCKRLFDGKLTTQLTKISNYDKINIIAREWMGSGVPSGLQNQHEGLISS